MSNRRARKLEITISDTSPRKATEATAINSSSDGDSDEAPVTSFAPEVKSEKPSTQQLCGAEPESQLVADALDGDVTPEVNGQLPMSPREEVFDDPSPSDTLAAESPVAACNSPFPAVPYSWSPRGIAAAQSLASNSQVGGAAQDIAGSQTQPSASQLGGALPVSEDPGGGGGDPEAGMPGWPIKSAAQFPPATNSQLGGASVGSAASQPEPTNSQLGGASVGIGASQPPSTNSQLGGAAASQSGNSQLGQGDQSAGGHQLGGGETGATNDGGGSPGDAFAGGREGQALAIAAFEKQKAEMLESLNILGGDDPDMATRTLASFLDAPRFQKIAANFHNAKRAETPPADIGGPDAAAGDGDKDLRTAAMFENLQKDNFNFAAQGNKDNPMAGLWQRSLKKDPGLKQMYAAVIGHKDKAEFRRKFAESKCAEFQSKKKVVNKFEAINTKGGKFRTVTRMAQEEGGGAAGLRAAINIAMSAIELGPEWYMWDARARNFKALYMETGYQENFAKAWELHEEWKSEVAGNCSAGSSTGDAGGGGEPSGQGSAEGIPSGSGCEGTQLGKRKGRGGAGKAVAAKKKGQQEKNDAGKGTMMQLLSHAKKIKTDYGALTAQSMALLSCVQKDPAWSWAKKEGATTDLLAAQAAVDATIEAGSFLQKALSQDIVQLKKTMNAAEFEYGLGEVPTNLEEPLQELRVQCAMLLGQHKARLEARKK